MSRMSSVAPVALPPPRAAATSAARAPSTSRQAISETASSPASVATMAGPMMPAAPTTQTRLTARAPAPAALQLVRAQRQPQLQPVAGVGRAAAGQRLDLADPVAQRVPVDAERGGGVGPAAVGLDVGRERLDQRRAVAGVVGAQRAEHRLAVELHAALVAEREQELDRAQVAERGHGRRPVDRPGLDGVEGLVVAPGQLARVGADTADAGGARARLEQERRRPPARPRRRRGPRSARPRRRRGCWPDRTSPAASARRASVAASAVAGRSARNDSGRVPRRPNARARRRSSRGPASPPSTASTRSPASRRTASATRASEMRVNTASVRAMNGTW